MAVYENSFDLRVKIKCEDLVNACDGLSRQKIDEKVQKVILKLWPLFNFDRCCGNVKGLFGWKSPDVKAEKCFRFLVEKINSILLNSRP
jgi:hypothetical protein